MADNSTLNDIKVETLSELKVEVAVLKQEVGFINRLFSRIEDVIDKIDTQHTTVLDKTTKIEYNLLSTKDELEDLYKILEDSEKNISSRINAIEKLLTDEINSMNKTLTDRVDRNEAKTVDLLQYKWLLWGGGVVVLWILSNIDMLKKIFLIK
jgi:DNA anti-recombination protein RmuC